MSSAAAIISIRLCDRCIVKKVVVYANNSDIRQSCALCRDWNLGDCEVCRREVKGMTVKKWLNRAWKLDVEINTLLKEQQKALELATGATVAPGGERVQTSKGNTVETKFLNYAAYAEMIDSRIDELYKIKQEILAAIHSVDDAVLRTLLIKRYIQNKTWECIADEMHYSYVHVVHNLHPQALTAVGKFVNRI